MVTMIAKTFFVVTFFEKTLYGTIVLYFDGGERFIANIQ